MFFDLVCKTKYMQEKFNHYIKKLQQMELIENAEHRQRTCSHKNRRFSVFFDLLCETKNMQHKLKQSNIINLWKSIIINTLVLIKIEALSIQKPQQIKIIENAEDEEGKQSASTLEQQRKCTRTHQNRSFSVKKWKKTKNNKTQKTGGQMKKSYEG